MIKFIVNTFLLLVVAALCVGGYLYLVDVNKEDSVLKQVVISKASKDKKLSKVTKDYNCHFRYQYNFFDSEDIIALRKQEALEVAFTAITTRSELDKVCMILSPETFEAQQVVEIDCDSSSRYERSLAKVNSKYFEYINQYLKKLEELSSAITNDDYLRGKANSTMRREFSKVIKLLDQSMSRNLMLPARYYKRFDDFLTKLVTWSQDVENDAVHGFISWHNDYHISGEVWAKYFTL